MLSGAKEQSRTFYSHVNQEAGAVLANVFVLLLEIMYYLQLGSGIAIICKQSFSVMNNRSI